MQVEPLSEAEAADLAALADDGNKRATPDHESSARPR